MGSFLSLDVGTTAVKGVLFDEQGEALAIDVQEYALARRDPGILEVDPGLYWNAARKAARNVLTESGPRAGRIESVGVTSQGETLITVGRDGAPLRPAMVWLDNRSEREASDIGQEFKIDEIYRLTGQQEMVPTWTATKVLWLRRNEPEVFERTHKFLLAGDYLLFRLTGRHITDCGLNPSTLYFDIIQNRWWADMLEYLGISEDQLPVLTFSGEEAFPISRNSARQMGLPEEATVTTAPIDQVAAAVGAGNIEPGIITETTGAALAVCATFDGPVYDPERRVPCHTHGVRGRYILLAWAPTGGMALRWFRDELGGNRDYTSLCAEARGVDPGADGLVFLPYLSGAGCPDMDPAAKGVFWGITLGHRRAHFTRAILESVAFVSKRNLELLETLGADAAEVRVLGGGARSDLWLQIKADMLGKPVVAMNCEESACLGVAMLSCVANGIYGDLAEARESMVHIRRRIQPDTQGCERYREIYLRYMRLHNQFRPLFHS